MLSWVPYLSCQSALTAQFPQHFQVDRDNELPLPFKVSVEDDLLAVSGALLDSIASLSTFNAREYDKSYPRNINEFHVQNAYGDKIGLQNALWRTLLADSLGGQSSVEDDLRDVLLPRFIWSRSRPG